MSLLSDEKINELLDKHGYAPLPSAFALYRAIEAAVLEAQRKQEPWPFSADRVTYHKAAPVVQPDMVWRNKRGGEDAS